MFSLVWKSFNFVHFTPLLGALTSISARFFVLQMHGMPRNVRQHGLNSMGSCVTNSLFHGKATTSCSRLLIAYPKHKTRRSKFFFSWRSCCVLTLPRNVLHFRRVQLPCYENARCAQHRLTYLMPQKGLKIVDVTDLKFSKTKRFLKMADYMAEEMKSNACPKNKNVRSSSNVISLQRRSVQNVSINCY